MLINQHRKIIIFTANSVGSESMNFFLLSFKSENLPLCPFLSRVLSLEHAINTDIKCLYLGLTL